MSSQPLTPSSPPLALLFVTTLTFAGCAQTSPVHHEFAAAVAVGRESWGLYERAPRLCESAVDGLPETAPIGECEVDFVRGQLGPSFYEENHAFGFRYRGADGTVLRVGSEREGAVLEVEVSGRAVMAGDLHRVTLGALIVVSRGPGYEEVEVALRAQVEGGDLALDLDEVRYHFREDGAESFYRTWYDTWRTPAGTFELEDGVFEGQRSAGGRWRLQAEGSVRLEGGDFAAVELGGPEGARRAVVASSGGALEL